MRFSLGFLAAMAFFAGPAVAQQQTIDESLTNVRVFDCALDGNQAIYVFRTSADGAISLVGDEGSPVRATDTGLTIMTANGLLEVSDGAYHIYGSGTAESGTCADITDFAHALYPAITEAYTPDATGGSVAEQAAAASLADLTVRTERAEAVSAAAASERDELQTSLEEQSNELAAARAQIDDLMAELAAARATAQAELEELNTAFAEATAASEEEVASLNADMAALTEERDGLSRLLMETEETLASTASMLEATEVELEELRALHAAATAAATDFQGQLGTAAAKLEATEADNRTLVATVAGLNSKISDLGATLRAARAERDAAQQKATDAGTSVVATSSLTNAAIARIATLQGRSQNAVRSELCRMIGRSGGC